MVYRLIALLSNVSSILENVFVVLLHGLHSLTVVLSESFETIVSFVNIFSFSMCQLLFQFSKILLIFSPGILLALIGYYHSMITLLIIGGIYISLLVLVAFGYRNTTTDHGSISGNVPNTWLWYFPYSWAKEEYIGGKLSNILQLHNRLRALSAEFAKDMPFKNDIAHIAKSSSFKLVMVRKNLLKIIARTQIKHGIKGYGNIFGHRIWSSNENYNTELRKNMSEYLDNFEKQYTHLVENIEDLHKNIQNLVHSDHTLNEGDKASFRTEIENVALLLKAVDSINEK